MMYIKEQSAHGTIAEQQWHIGEPMPYLSPAARVISFQADGEELDVILDAIRAITRREIETPLTGSQFVGKRYR